MDRPQILQLDEMGMASRYRWWMSEEDTRCDLHGVLVCVCCVWVRLRARTIASKFSAFTCRWGVSMGGGRGLD